MAGQSDEAASAANATDPGTSRTRQRSSIAFPYMDLEAAITLARAIHDNVGHGVCDDDQLAAWAGQSPKSSTFRVQVYAARTFGILSGEGSRHELSAIGQAIVDPQREREARTRAFLTVPLFSAIHEKYRGTVLPPAAALERDIAALGVAEKQKGRARQVFERSAEEAGFFEHGKTRLVMPGVNPASITPASDNKKPSVTGGESSSGYSVGGNGGGGGDGTPDPLIGALIQKLPPADSAWSVDNRVAWLQMMAMAFNMAYGTDSNIDIKKNEAAN